jgi:hypothetical protein
MHFMQTSDYLLKNPREDVRRQQEATRAFNIVKNDKTVEWQDLLR